MISPWIAMLSYNIPKFRESYFGLKPGESLGPGPGLAITRNATVANGPNQSQLRDVPVYGPVTAAPQQGGGGSNAPEPSPPKKPVAENPTNLDVGSGRSQFQDQIDALLKQMSSMQTQQTMPTIEIPKPSVSSSTSVIDNATGFNRKQSSARKAGLTTKGTSRLRINRTGQTTASSGLNIGV